MEFSCSGLFHIHIRISFPFLIAKDLGKFLFIMRTCSFFTLMYVGGTYAHMITVLIVFIVFNGGKVIWWKKYQNDTAMRQRQDSDTVSDTIASKINTLKNKTRTGHQQDRDKIFKSIHQLKDFLPFWLLTSHFVWWRFACEDVGRASLPYLAWYRHRWKQLRCKLNTQILYN